jgi:anaerobic selenocysteine-containing dehydrogenase
LNVNVATKLNRSHLIHGEISYILPCLSRIEIDRQASGDQAVSMEDSTACVHGSHGVAEPPSENIRSEPFILAGIAKATLEDRFAVDWNAWRDDYSVVRDEIAKTYPEIFHDFSRRMWTPGGFPKPLPARERQWQTKSGRAEFLVPKELGEDPDMPERGTDALRLMTLRSDSQFNTTIYSLDDRFRGVKGNRMVVLMNKDDIAASSLSDGDMIGLETIANDGVDRRVSGLTVMAYDIPRGCIAGYYPECNPLLPLWHCAEESKVPAAKSIPVRIVDKPGRQPAV